MYHNLGLLTGGCRKMLHNNNLLLWPVSKPVAPLESPTLASQAVRLFSQVKLCSMEEWEVGKQQLESLQHMSNLFLQQCS